MKRVRSWLISLGIVLVLGSVGLVLALTPGFQRWALLRAMGSTNGLKFEVERVSVGFSRVELDGVRMEKKGAILKFDRLDADYSPWQMLFSRRLASRELTVTGMEVDFTHYSRVQAGAVSATVPVTAPGLLARIKLPWIFQVEDCRFQGHARLPGAAGKAPIEADFKIIGGKFAPGEEGTLRLVATFKDPLAEARVADLQTQIILRAVQTAQKSLSRVAISAVLEAKGRDFSEETQLKMAADLQGVAEGEKYSFRVDTLLRGSTENLLAVHATLPKGRQEFAGDWTVKARTAQLEPFSLGTALPDFDARGGGNFTFNRQNNGASFKGTLQAEASRLEEIAAPLRVVGLIKIRTQFDMTLEEGVARFTQLDLQLDGDHPVLELQAARAAELNFKEHRLQVGDLAGGEALNLNLHNLPVAWVRPFVDVADISGGAISGQLIVTGEDDRLLLRMAQPLHVGELSVRRGGELQLNKADLLLNASGILTKDELRVVIKDAALTTPAGDTLHAQANFSLPVVPDPTVDLEVSYNADLPAMVAPWLPLGHVRAAGGIDLTVAGKKIKLRQLNSSVTDDTGLPLFKIATLRPFEFDRITGRATPGAPVTAAPVATGGNGLMKISLGKVPLKELVALHPGLILDGMIETGEFLASAEGEKIAIRAVAPINLTGVSLAQDGQPVVTGLAFQAQPEVTLSRINSFQMKTGEVSVATSAGVNMATFQYELAGSVETGLRGSMTFSVEIPVLATQPLFAGVQAVSQGRATGEVRLVSDPAKQIEARVTLNGLVTDEGGQPLPVANLSFRATVQSDGRMSIQAPLLFDRAGERSDLNFALDLVPSGEVYSVDGKLTSDHADLADALTVMGVFVAAQPRRPVPGTPPPAAENSVADAVPAWSRFKGKLLLDLKSVTKGPLWAMTGLNGVLTIDPKQIALQKLTADFGADSHLGAQASLGFSSGAQPYGFSGSFSVTAFDTGKFFKALEPERAPTIEGLFEVNAKFSGVGGTLRRTLENTRGTFDLTSRQGVFRGLQRSANKISMGSKAVELGASVLGSLIGSEKGIKTAERVAGQAYFVDQLAPSLGELNYDQLTVRLTRDESLNLTLDDVSLLSPELRLIGKGTVEYQAGVSPLEQPLTLSLSLAARGKIEQLLGKLKLLDGTQDDLGYAQTREPVAIGGTLAKPDASPYYYKILITKFSELVAPENSGN